MTATNGSRASIEGKERIAANSKSGLSLERVILPWASETARRNESEKSSTIELVVYAVVVALAVFSAAIMSPAILMLAIATLGSYILAAHFREKAVRNEELIGQRNYSDLISGNFSAN